MGDFIENAVVRLFCCGFLKQFRAGDWILFVFTLLWCYVKMAIPFVYANKNVFICQVNQFGVNGLSFWLVLTVHITWYIKSVSHSTQVMMKTRLSEERIATHFDMTVIVY